MEVTLVNLRRLRIAFEDAWRRVSAGERPESVGLETASSPASDAYFWTCYMNSLDCLMIDKDDLLESFEDMVNFGKAVKESVCLKDPCNEGDFILVHKELAEKILVLGVLP